jgi:hypothetical protein
MFRISARFLEKAHRTPSPWNLRSMAGADLRWAWTCGRCAFFTSVRLERCATL